MIVVGEKSAIVKISELLQVYNTVMHHRDNSRIEITDEQLSSVPQSLLYRCDIEDDKAIAEETE